MSEPSLGHFIDTRTADSPDGWVSFADLYDTYCKYVRSYLPEDDPTRYSELHVPNKRFFGKMIRSKGFTPKPHTIRARGSVSSIYAVRGLELSAHPTHTTHPQEQR